MKLVGEYLKKHREVKNISLEQASLVTKISAGTLRAIESANTRKLPSKSYLRGFVFSYGQFLNVDKNELEKLFTEEVGSTNPEIQQEIVQQQTWQTIPVINKVRINAKTFIIAGLVVMLLLAVSVQSIIKKYQNEKIIVPNAEISETNKIQHSEPIKASSQARKNQEAPTKDKPNLGNSDKKAQIITQDTIYNAPTGLKELIVEAVEDTSVTIQIGEKDEKIIKLLSGDFHTIKARSKLVFQTQKPKSIKLIYNGVLQTKNSNDEAPMTITY